MCDYASVANATKVEGGINRMVAVITHQNQLNRIYLEGDTVENSLHRQDESN